MITKENLKWYFENLDEMRVKELDKNGDYCYCNILIFNTGGVASLECDYYDEQKSHEIDICGGLFCDKDDFFRLYEECGAENEFIEKYL